MLDMETEQKVKRGGVETSVLWERGTIHSRNSKTWGRYQEAEKRRVKESGEVGELR